MASWILKNQEQKLNPDFKVKWLEALRSGKYKQELGALKTESGYCCLGVACDLQDKVSRTRKSTYYWSYDELDDNFYFNIQDKYGDVLEADNTMIPNSIGRDIGLTSEAAHELADLNDAGASFETIADTIEEYL